VIALMMEAVCTSETEITLMMESVRTSEMLINFYKTTWRNIPEGCHLQNCATSINDGQYVTLSLEN
jgi:hypothetical protein